ncbi:hypothetical protein H5395_14015 [Paracoccus sp. MC1854]|uniref:right-handed parallel beta-helix repeat-containing protein n=1 Tax=Paracoccus sp. MC1854 TaxID=2760306 RepID=UPI0015FFCA81|nr:right-handed parallel beta-helix repeat-containing protein [Paracoccus sp. MC1854]MBB1492629.1 hypothetical protein [Paracoccus sp. MC1854]
MSHDFFIKALSGSMKAVSSFFLTVAPLGSVARGETPYLEPSPATAPDMSQTDPHSGQVSRSDVMSATAQADRVTWLELPSSVTADSEVLSIRILVQPDHGQVSVTPDLKLALVMTGAEQDLDRVDFRYEVTRADASVVEVNAEIDLTPARQAAGWGLGETYMLETDSDGELVLEHGDEHRKVHVTAGKHGLTAREIAREEGLDAVQMEGKWGQWLKDHPEYGATEDKALDTELGMALWTELSFEGDRTSSNWLLFERGYEYDKEHATRLIHRGSNGESELYPLVVTAYGEGEDPRIGGDLNIFQEVSSHVVLHGIDLLERAQVLEGRNILLDKVSIRGDGGNFQKVDGLTFRRSDIVDIAREQPVNDGPIWHAHINRIGGAYIDRSTGVLIEENLFDHNGWAKGYDQNVSATAPMPPSMFSHNLYIQADNLDVTVRDNIFLRGASFGAQIRSGGFIEDNAFIDNNAAVNFLGGDYQGAGPAGNYTLFTGNLVTSAGHKRVAEMEGALSMGVEDKSLQSSLIGNIIAHLADPANPDEIAAKSVTHRALNSNADRFFDDTIVYKWAAGTEGLATNPNRGVEGLDPLRLDKVTIQKFTADLLGKPDASIGDLAAVLRAQANGQLDHVVDADLINAFFRAGFGLDTSLRTAADTLVFVPDERGDGVRWDSRLNWSTGDLPGTQAGDSVDLAGNAVRFGSITTTVHDLAFGDFGKLSATSGKLTVAGEIEVGASGAALSIDRAGQVWIDGYHGSGLLEIDAAGGRLANTGALAGPVALQVSDNAQALLATAGGSFDLAAGSRLTLEGSRIATGFDAQDGAAAVLRLHKGAALDFVADADGLSTLGEFRSGAFDETSQLDSAVQLGGTLTIDLSGWELGQSAPTITLMKADQIVGDFDDIEIIGLGPDRDALLQIDHLDDEIRLMIGRNGAGKVTVATFGSDQVEDWADDPAYLELWQALQAQPLPDNTFN